MSTQYEPGAQVPEGFIPLCVPEIRGNEWKYIKECLDTNWVSSVGTYVDKFERMIADYVGTKYAVATVNGTAALHIALLVSGIQRRFYSKALLCPLCKTTQNLNGWLGYL